MSRFWTYRIESLLELLGASLPQGGIELETLRDPGLLLLEGSYRLELRWWEEWGGGDPWLQVTSGYRCAPEKLGEAFKQLLRLCDPKKTVGGLHQAFYGPALLFLSTPLCSKSPPQDWYRSVEFQKRCLVAVEQGEV